MIISWNVRGLNKKAISTHVGAHIRKLHVHCIALLETRVKIKFVEHVRKKLGSGWRFVDYYNKYDNGRIWMMWNPSNWNVKPICMYEQVIHNKIYKIYGTFSHHLYVVYAHNQLTKRKSL